MKRLLKGLLWLFIAVVALPFLMIAVLQVSAGRTFVSNMVSSLASSPDQTIAVEDLSIGWSLDASVAGFSLADQTGVWLKGHDIKFAWSPPQLLTGTINIDALTAKGIEILRAPVASATENTTESTKDPKDGGIPMLPGKLGKLQIDSLVLGPTIAGEEVTLGLSASGSLDSAPMKINAKFDLTRIDESNGTISAAIRFEPTSETLAFDLSVHEPRGGLVARLLDVPNLPALDVTLIGDGPLTDWASNLAIALDGRETVTGKALLSEAPIGRKLALDLDGNLSPLMPDIASAFFIGTTDLTGTAYFDPDFMPLSGDINLATQTLQFAGRGSFNRAEQAINASAALKVSADDNRLIALDLPDRRIMFGPLSADVNLSGLLTDAAWNINILANSLGTTEGKIGETKLTFSGSKTNLTPESLSSGFALKFSVSDIDPSDQKLAAFAGPLEISASGDVSAETEKLKLAAAQLTTSAVTLDLEPSVFSPEDFTASGKMGIGTLSAFSDLANKPLGGSLAVTFQAKGVSEPQKANIDITASGRNIQLGTEQLDALLDDTTTLTASIMVDGPKNVELTSLALKASGLETSGKASLKDDTISAELTGLLQDLTRINPEIAGSLKFDVSAEGPLTAAEVNAALSSGNLIMSGTPLKDFQLTADVVASSSEPQGHIESSGTLNGAPLTLTADLSSKDGAATIENLKAELDGNSISGQFLLSDLSKAPDSLSGNLTINAPTLAALSPLVLRPISGSLEGELVAKADKNSTQTISLDLKGNALSTDGLDIGDLSAKATIATPFETPQINTSVLASSILAGSTPIQSVKLDAINNGTQTNFETIVRLTDSAKPDGLTAKGRLEQFPDRIALSLDTFDGTYEGLKTQIREPAKLTYADGLANVENLTLALGSGSLSISGSAGDALDLTANLNKVPLALANAFVPDAGVAGFLSGTVRVTGSSIAPVANWTLSANGLTAKPLSQKGLPTLNVASTGKLDSGLVTQKTTLSGPTDLVLTAEGKVGIERPQSLNLALNGSLPLSFLRRPLTEAGLRAGGGVTISGSVGGTLSNPQYSLTAKPKGITITELTSAVTLQEVTGSVDVTPAGITLSSLSAKLASGGSVAVSGSVKLGPTLDANIKATATQARYIDPGLVTAVVDADIAITGPLSSTSEAAQVSGEIKIRKADISIPESLGGAVPAVAVQHINAPKAIRSQMTELGADKQDKATQDTSGLPPRLNVKLSAPGKIFIRGRGLDAELFGDLTISGTTEDPQALGAFNLKRGQMDILTRRLAFSKGTATFFGDLTPVINFLATTTVNGTTISISVTGKADDPIIAFSSAPELPQDEVLALLLFGTEMGSLSPGQIAELAGAIRTLSGGGSDGPLSQIRKSLGLDTLDINTQGEDGPTIGVGRYINDNIYLGVEQGTNSAGSRVRVDIDLDKGLKLRGEVGANGSSKAGIFFERDY
ncbi:translocation/assembly module TamB domain-containing protein [Roseibium algae]|uniref:Translocation/assembly module TamB domain-containing protein n=1 Tax=Roseibium algae TaxID=3123038 RepID=A0ABU8TPP3_9HYPH